MNSFNSGKTSVVSQFNTKCSTVIHQWSTEKDDGVFIYQKCLNCSSKQVLKRINSCGKLENKKWVIRNV
jgi:hypothetical protein